VSGSGEAKKLGELLVSAGFASASLVDEVLGAQRNGARERIGSLLVQRGVAERDVARILATRAGAPAVVLSESVLDLNALGLIPRVVAERQRILPLRLGDDTIVLAASDVGDREIFDQIRFASGRQVEVVVGLDSLIADTLPRAYAAYGSGRKRLAGHPTRVIAEDEPALIQLARPELNLEGLPADEELFSVEEAPIDSDEIRASPRPSNPVVLVVEDEPSIRQLLVRLLAGDGYFVVEASDGREALDQIRRHQPNLVLLDAMLPEIHGFEICASIKRSEAYARIPVIMISAIYRGWENARDIQEVHGADAFVEKPFDINYIRKLVAETLGRKIDAPKPPSDKSSILARAREAAQASYKRSDDDAAFGAIEAWMGIDPFDPLSYLMLGNIHHRRGDYETAMKCYERAVTFGPRLYAAAKNLAVVYERLGFVRRALSLWRRALETSPDAGARARIQERISRRYGDVS